MANVVRKVIKDGKTYRLTYDEYNTLDTIELNGVSLVSTQRPCQQIIRNADKFLTHEPVSGFHYE